MAAATVDMNQKIILINLDIIEEQRRQTYHAVDQYVDKVIDAGKQWTTRRERSHSTFLDIQKITTKAMAFLSLKCEEMKSELESETSHLIRRDEFTQQQKNSQMDPVAKPVTTHGKAKEDDTDDVKQIQTSRNPNLASDQQTRYQDVYNQLKSVLAKQDELEQQLNMKLNNLIEDTESLKSDVGTFNQYVETGKTLLSDYSQKLETLENTVSCLSEKGNEMYLDQQVLVDRINSHLSDNDDQVNIDLSANVDQINTELSAKVDQVTTDLSAKVDQINTDLSAKVDQIYVVLQTLTNSEKEHAAQINKIIDLEKHFNTMEKDTQNNDKQVEQKQDELGAKLLDVMKKLSELSVEVDKKRDFGVAGFKTAAILPPVSDLCNVTMFKPHAFIAGFQFDSVTGIFKASSQGIYLAFVSICLDEYRDTCLHLIHGQTGYYDEREDRWHDHETQICSVKAERKESIMCSLGMVDMEEGDKLFIRNAAFYNVSCRIQLLCFRLG